ncbi:membrane protein [Herbaspirillum rubrisubalbicans]|uniref:Membrane protein n=1 Tax=Herbaspirillum rubrisubalbicans TaxID=80842 RepID=A0ABX9C1H6_9BURK|nr:TonB-dependent siderophore receptor [Herbaspirillum rubrisubalbicans]RAM64256.1 membrane protein [Herbaspirillum rubrisubalbicans]RAN49801.1 membrane protein [Herbaspirillum rubrisubalbicans]
MNMTALRAAVLGALAMAQGLPPAWSADATAGSDSGLGQIVVTGTGERQQYRQSSTSSATRTETPLQELPQSVQVVSRQLIDDLGAQRLDDVLLYVSGVAKQNNFGGLWDNYSIRGFSGSDNGGMNILWNGFASNRGYAPPRDLANVESVDFLKGPAAALYGNSEPGGTINVVSKKPQFKRANALDLSIGSNDSYRSSIDSTGALNSELAYRLNAAVERRGSWRDDIHSQREFFAPALTWVLSDSTVLNYEAEFLRQQVPFDRGIVAVNGNLGVLPISRFLGEPGDGDVKMDNQNHLLTLEHRLNDNWHLRTGLFHKEGTLQGYSTEASALQADNATLRRQRRYRDYGWHDTSLQFELGGKLTTGSVGHEVLVGTELDWMTLDQRMLRVNPTTAAPYAINIYNPVYGQPLPTPRANTDTSERQSSSAFYLQDQISLTQRWKLLAGIRADAFSSTLNNWRTSTITRQDKNAYSPRLGLTYLFTPSWSAYASASKSFRPNSGSDIHGRAFSPETSRAAEVGLKFQSADQRSGATLAVFDITKQNVLTADPSNPAFSIAAGEVRSKGVELDANAKLGHHWRLTGNLAYTDAYVSKDNTLAVGSRLLNVPRVSGSVLAVFEDALASGSPYGIGGGLNYVGDRTGDQAGSFQLPAYLTARALAYWQLTPKMKLSLDVDNLFNKRYYSSSYSSVWIMPGNERTATLALNVKF